ncbi:MAG: CRTAC1 family protein [Isosphaeraceae bacterium]
MTPGPRPDPADRRPPSWYRPWPLLVCLAAAGPLSGCRDDAPAGRTVAAAAPAKPAAEPPRGPVWFVDRAREFGMDVVTKCGTPEKTSVLDSIGTGVALFDIDGDGDLDVFVAPGSEVRDGKVVSAGGPWLFRNDGPGRWADVSKPSGLRYTGWAQGAAVCDYDADGDLDLFVPHHGQDALWRNKGDGTFEDVTKAAGLGGENEWGVSATWGDYDGDGWPDLYVTNYLVVDALRPPELSRYYGGPTMVFRGPDLLDGQPDRLWRNRGDGTFEDVTKSAGLSSPQGKGMSALFADLDGDGILDLFVTNDGQANELFRGLGRGRFREEAAQSGAAYSDKGLAEAGMAIALADLDGDGRLDLVRTNFHHQGTRLIRNADGLSYVDVSQCSGMTALTYRLVGWGLVAEDFDEDGRPDLFQANGHVFPKGPADPYHQPPLLVRNLNGDRFEDMTRAWGQNLDSLRSGRAVASGDLDGDGDVDLVMTTIDGPLRVLINEGERASHGVTVRLAGDRPNREAIGARVEVHAGGRVHVGAVCRGGSILAASDPALHFGLGDARSIDRVRVVWPDGTDTTYPGAGLAVDATLTVRQSSGKVDARPYATAPAPGGL